MRLTRRCFIPHNRRLEVFTHKRTKKKLQDGVTPLEYLPYCNTSIMNLFFIDFNLISSSEYCDPDLKVMLRTTN